MPGTTAFPAALDTFPAIDATTQENGAGVEHDVVHANVHAAVSALEARVGITSSADATSLEHRVAAVESGKVSTSAVGAANGVAGLNALGQVPTAQLPSYVDDVLEYANLEAFPGTGESGKIYIAIDTGRQYRWSGSAYTQLVASPGTTDALSEGSNNLYFTASRVRDTLLTGLAMATNAVITAADSVLLALGKLQRQVSDNLTALTAHTGSTGNPHGVTKADIGLGNVDNTSDANKPVSAAQAAAIAAATTNNLPQTMWHTALRF